MRRTTLATCRYPAASRVVPRWLTQLLLKPVVSVVFCREKPQVTFLRSSLKVKMQRLELSIKITPGKLYWQPDVFISVKPNLQLLGNVNTVNPTYSTLKKNVQEEFGLQACR